MVITCASFGTGVFAAEDKSATAEISVYDNGFLLEPTVLTVSAGLSAKYKNEVGYDDEQTAPTMLDAFIAAHIKLYGEKFYETAAFTVEIGYYGPGITAAFGKQTTGITYSVNGAMASGIDAALADGDCMDINVYQDTEYWSDTVVSFSQRKAVAGVGDTIALTATYDTYDSNWNMTTLPAEGLDVLVNGKSVGTTDAAGNIAIAVNKANTYYVTATGTVNGSVIFAPRCTITTNVLATHINVQKKKAAAYLMKTYTGFDVDSAPHFVTLLRSGADMSAYQQGFADDVKANLEANGGKLLDKNGTENLGIYGAVILCLNELGYNAESFEGYNLQAAFEAAETEAARPHQYYYKYAIEVADETKAKALIDDLIANYYTMGKGMDNWGFSCDNACHFVLAIAPYRNDYGKYKGDAINVIKSYKKDGGAYADAVYVKEVNADSTALSMAAYAACGNAKTAYPYYKKLVTAFESQTGVFTTDGKANLMATEDALLALEYFEKAVCDSDLPHSEHINTVTKTAATYAKAGKVVTVCKICGKKTVKVLPKLTVKATVFTKVKKGKRKLAVKWKKVKGVSGYQLQYSTDKKFKKARTKTVQTTKTAKTVKKLKSKKRYYVRVRAYKKVGGKTYYSKWSKVKAVKVK